jgi:hypothetical protein
MLTRRSFLEKAVAAGTVALIPACSSETADPVPAPAPGSTSSTPPAPAPPGPTEPTPTNPVTPDPDPDPSTPTESCIEATEDDPLGPYYTANPPKRTTLVEDGMLGTRLVVEGRVLGVGAAGATCNALAGAEVDVWQANDAGDYDNAGYTLRGIFTSDANGKYRVETILPGRYLDGAEYRPRHIHVRVRAPGKKELITQLYFEGDPYNATDGMFKPSLAMKPKDDGKGGLIADFHFVLA